MTTMADYEHLLDEARLRYRVPPLTTVPAVAAWLIELGATRLDFERYAEDLVDEFVEGRLVVGAFVLHAPGLLQERATLEEREHFVDDEPFDPNEYGAENAEWTTLSHDVATLRSLIIVLEQDHEDAAKPGNYRVYGAGQWLRESLWAATGVVPFDPGAPSDMSDLFGRAFPFVNRAPLSPFPLG